MSQGESITYGSVSGPHLELKVEVMRNQLSFGIEERDRNDPYRVTDGMGVSITRAAALDLAQAILRVVLSDEEVRERRAEQIVSEVMCDDLPGGPYKSLSGDDLRGALTIAARKGLEEAPGDPVALYREA